jgi:hypothetical protein
MRLIGHGAHRERVQRKKASRTGQKTTTIERQCHVDVPFI